MGHDACTVGEALETWWLPERVKGYPLNSDSIAVDARWPRCRDSRPDPARYGGQQSIEFKATVLPELNVPLNNARSLMAVPRLAEILVLCISKCVGRHADPHDVCANGKIDVESL